MADTAMRLSAFNLAGVAMAGSRSQGSANDQCNWF